VKCSFHGHDTIVHLATDAKGLPPILRARVSGGLVVDVGTWVHVGAKGPFEAWPNVQNQDEDR
jgi:hypothetical protein